MNTLLSTIIPLGLGICLSPEILVIGLWLAKSSVRARTKTWLFFLTGMVGLIIWTVAGSFLHVKSPQHASWTAFFIRAGLGTALLFAALRLLFKKEKEPEKIKPPRFANGASLGTAAGLGFASTGLNLKVISLAMTAGHQMAMLAGPQSVHMAAAVFFFSLGLSPLLLPALLETIKPGMVAAVLGPYDHLLVKYGRWVVAAICFFMSVKLWLHALAVLP